VLLPAPHEPLDLGAEGLDVAAPHDVILARGARRTARPPGAAWLSVRRLIVVGLLDGELGRRVCLQAFVRDGRAGADRAAVGAVFKPLEGTIEGRESVPQTSGHGVVDALFSQWLRRITHIARLAFGLTVIRLSRVEVGQQLLHPRPLRVQ
jgi:hypothetical protein